MRFVDSNVFIHAFLKPKRNLSQSEARLRESAKKIVTRINSGEKVITSVVHLAEIANILEDNLPLPECARIERALVMNENIDVASISREDCIAALGEADETGVGMDDSIARIVMKRGHMTEIYSFDRDFDTFTDLKRLVE